MTATLDFTPSAHRLNGVRAARRLPVYEVDADWPETVLAPSGPASESRSVGSYGAPTDAPAAPSAVRIVGAVVVAALIVVGFVVFGSDAAARGTITPASTDSAVVDATVEVYVVQPGDTLWAIAGRLAPEGADLRPIVDQLSASAGGAQLEIGQRLVIDHDRLGG